MVHVFSTLVHVSQTVYVHSMYYLRILHAFDTFHSQVQVDQALHIDRIRNPCDRIDHPVATSQESFGRLELPKELYRHMCDRGRLTDISSIS